MRVLALETSLSDGSIAALDGLNLLAELKLPSHQRSAQSLAPAMKSLLDQVGWRPGEVELVAVTTGPGSFTGLRVGITAAKTFAYTTKAEILGVDTLEAICEGCPAEISTLATAVDAQRGQVVAVTFQRSDGGWRFVAGPPRLMDLDAWLASIPAGAHAAGPLLGKIAPERLCGVLVVDSRYWLPSAAAVGRLAARHHAGGRRDDLWTLAPRYYRPSAAEEKLDEKERST